MRLVRSPLHASAWVLALLLAACGEKDAPAPAPAPPPLPASAPQDPEVWDEDRFFATVGPRSIRVDFGRKEEQSAEVVSGMLPRDDDEARTKLLLDVETKLAEVLKDVGRAPPVFQIRAEPATPWVRIADLIAVATGPEIGLTSLDLRLPWDQGPRMVTVAEADVEGHPLPIDFAYVEPEEGLKARWLVKVGAASTFSFHDEYAPALRKLDEPSMRGLRSALQGFTRTWRDKRRRAEIVIPRVPSPTYVNVLTVVRICGEKDFDELTFRDQEG